MTNAQLRDWLRANSSGIYRPAAEAADRMAELETALIRCVAEMKHSAEMGQPVSEDRVEFKMAEAAINRE